LTQSPASCQAREPLSNAQSEPRITDDRWATLSYPLKSLRFVRAIHVDSRRPRCIPHRTEKSAQSSRCCCRILRDSLCQSVIDREKTPYRLVYPVAGTLGWCLFVGGTSSQTLSFQVRRQQSESAAVDQTNARGQWVEHYVGLSGE
jgi:hypothetical protein